LDLKDIMLKSARFTQLALSRASYINNKRRIGHNNNSNRMETWHRQNACANQQDIRRNL